MFRWMMAALFLAMAGPVSAAESDAEQAFAAFQAHEYGDAAERYGRIAADFAERYPESPGKRYYCARSAPETLLYMGMAAADKVSGVALAPTWCQALFMQAYSYIELKKIDLALAPLERAVELAPLDAQYANELGFVYRSLGRLDEAMTSYRAALAGLDASPDVQAVNRHKAVALRGIGWIHAEHQQWDEAEQAYNQSLEANPGNQHALSELKYIEENRPRD